MGNRNFEALENVDLVLTAAMPEGIVFRARVPKGLVIRVWCMMEEDDMIRELIREFTEITLEELLKTLGCSGKQSTPVSSILARLSLNLEVDNVKHLWGKSWMKIDFETWKKFVEGAKIMKVELKPSNSLYFEFDTGMVSRVQSEKQLQLDFKWLKGYEFLSKKALDIYLKRIMGSFQAEQIKKMVKEKH